MDPIKQNGQKLLDAALFRIGGTPITVETLISASIVLAITLAAVWLVRMLVKRTQARIGEDRAAGIYIGGQVLRYTIIVVGLSATISTLGINLSALSIFAGALGVGIGLGLQDVVKNFVCGIILLFDRSIEVGDYVELSEGAAGIVSSIGPRATNLLTNDNVDVMVSNADLLNGQLTNWTRNRGTRRIHIPFGVAYGTDKELVKTAALEAARAVPFTMADDAQRKTQVWLVGFGDSSLDFELVVWPSLAAVKRPGSMKAAYFWALDDALRAHGIEVPYPQRDLRLRSFFGSEGAAALAALRDRDDAPADGVCAPPGGNGGRNDAAQDIADEPA